MAVVALNAPSPTPASDGFSGRPLQATDLSSGSPGTLAPTGSTAQRAPRPFDELISAARPAGRSGLSSSPASLPGNATPAVSPTADALRTASLKRSKSARMPPALAEQDRQPEPVPARQIRPLSHKRLAAEPADASPGTGTVGGVVNTVERPVPLAAAAASPAATTLAAGPQVTAAQRLHPPTIAETTDTDGGTLADASMGPPPAAEPFPHLSATRVAAAGTVAAAVSTTLTLPAAAALVAARDTFLPDANQLLRNADLRAGDPGLEIASSPPAPALSTAVAPPPSALKSTAEAIGSRLPLPVVEPASKRSARPDGSPLKAPVSKQPGPARVDSAPVVPAFAAQRTSLAAPSSAPSGDAGRPSLPNARALLKPPLAEAGASGFSIDSQWLGPVSAALSPLNAVGDRLHVHFTVDRAATAALIAGDSDRLDATLGAAGMRLGSLAVAVGPHPALGQSASSLPWSSSDSAQNSASRSDAHDPRRGQPDPSGNRPQPTRSHAPAALTRDRFA